MTTIRLTTWVNAPAERCYRLATSMAFLNAVAPAAHINGQRQDILEVGDTFLWKGRRWGMNFSHTSRIEELRPFSYFREVLVSGSFRHFQHEHHFAPMDDGTRVRDEVHFSARLGVLIEHPILRGYVGRLLVERHRTLKRVAESAEWRKYLEIEPRSGVRPEHPSKIVNLQRFA